MSLAIFSYFGYKLPLAERIRLIAQAGFTHTSLWWGPPDEEFTQGRQHTTPDLVRNAGLVLENLHVPFEECNDLWSPHKADRDRFIARHTGWLKDCARHNVPCMILHVTYGVEGVGPGPEGLAAFRRVVEAAEENGVTLAIENTRRDDLLDFLFSNIESPRLGFCYDSSHDWLWGTPRTGTLARWGRRLVQTHLSDTLGHADRHLVPGDGHIAWERIAVVFPRSTYAGPLMLEVLPPVTAESAPPAIFLAKARERLEWLTGLLR